MRNVGESVVRAIVHHIAERSPALMPKDPGSRSQVTAWMFGALNSIEPPVMMLNILDMIYQGPKGDDYNGIRAWVAGWVESRLDILVGVLEGKEYVLGRFSAADLLLTTVLRILRDTDFVKKRAVLAAYQRRCEAPASVSKSTGGSHGKLRQTRSGEIVELLVAARP